MSAMNHQCGMQSCNMPASKRCSRCKTTFYCSIEHQKEDWAVHKLNCPKISADTTANNSGTTKQNNNNLSTEFPSSSSRKKTNNVSGNDATSEGSQNSNTDSIEQRSCRCMFCGENLILANETEAVDHMRVCPALQEQLASKDQFTIPSVLQDKIDKGKNAK